MLSSLWEFCRELYVESLNGFLPSYDAGTSLRQAMGMGMGMGTKKYTQGLPMS